MQDWSDITNLPDEFDGRVRLFPLPELVVFPHAMQPLHIFEPRYCEMLREALAGDQLIAMATLQSTEKELIELSKPEGKPAIEPIICIGRIVSHTELEGDRHNVLLVGTKRARIRSEFDPGRTFRMAQVEVMDDVYPPENAAHRGELKNDLLRAFASIIPSSANVQKNLHDLMAGQMGLGPITDIVSYTLPFDVPDKIELLGQADVDSRAKQLIGLLQSGKIKLHSVSIEEQSVEDSKSSDGMIKSRGQKGFPPPFSLN